jgi:hypothetical protein
LKFDHSVFSFFVCFEFQASQLESEFEFDQNIQEKVRSIEARTCATLLKTCCSHVFFQKREGKYFHSRSYFEDGVRWVVDQKQDLHVFKGHVAVAAIIADNFSCLLFF